MVLAISTLGVDFVRTDHVQTTNGQRVVVRAPEARRNRVLDPRSSILPMTTSTMVDYCYAWAGIFDRRIADLLTFPDGLFTAEDRSWAWRLHLQAASYAVVGHPGILYRRGVSDLSDPDLRPPPAGLPAAPSTASSIWSGVITKPSVGGPRRRGCSWRCWPTTSVASSR